MNHYINNTLLLIGRIAIASLFIPAGINKITNFSGTVGYINSIGLPFPEIGAVLAVFIELIVGIMFLVGFKTKYTAAILSIFTLTAGFLFHNFWSMPVDKVMIQQIMFFKNIAIVGGLFSFIVYGAGIYAVDALKIKTIQFQPT